MTLNATNIMAAIAVVTLLITLGTSIYQLGKLSNQLDTVSAQIEVLREDMQRGDQELHEEIRRVEQDLREEIRRSNRQLLYALANHKHDADGDAVFTVPPEPGPAGANPNQSAPAR